MYAIACWFQVAQNSEMLHGFAICSDADTPITFIYPNGEPYTGKDIWNYSLRHFEPWGKIGH